MLAAREGVARRRMSMNMRKKVFTQMPNEKTWAGAPDRKVAPT